MTVTPTSEVIASPRQNAPVCPAWCRQHLTSHPDALLHLCDLGEVWGATPSPFDEEKISITLERHDDDGVVGEPYLSFRYSSDGRYVDQVVDLPLPVAERLLFSGLSLVAYGRNDGRRAPSVRPSNYPRL